MPMGDEVVSIPEKGSQASVRHWLLLNTEDSIILFNVDNPVARAEGDFEVVAWVKDLCGGGESDDSRRRRYDTQ